VQKAEVIKTLKEGEIRSGVVTSLREFGAFVDIGGADGLIHISELSWHHVDNPGNILKVGDEIDSLVIRLDTEANRIGLSLKRLQPNPWLDLIEQIQPGMVLDGVVSRHVTSGLYVTVNEGIDGLVRSQHTLDLPSVGDSIQVRVLTFEPERERMSLEIIEAETLIPQTAIVE
jgi:small subunit ribosomal protein S1